MTNWFKSLGLTGPSEPASESASRELPGPAGRQEGPQAGAEPAPVTAPVTEPEPYVEPPMPTEPEDELTIPPFLLRRPDGEPMYPSTHDPSRWPAVDPKPVEPPADPRTLKPWNMTDERLTALMNDPATALADKQPLYREMYRRQKVRQRALDKERELDENGPSSTD